MHHNKNYSKIRLDPDFDLEKNYFFIELTNKQWEEIKRFIDDSFKHKTDKIKITKFFKSFDLLGKGNISLLRELLDNVSENHKDSPHFFEIYKLLNNFLNDEYMMPKPAILDCVFFPNENNADKVINMLRTCKKSLDIAIFTITNDKIFLALEEVYKLGRQVRIITDDECCKQNGSDVYRLAAIVFYKLYRELLLKLTTTN